MTMNYSADINGITVNATYSDTTVNEVFIPLLKHLAQLHNVKQRRILVMLAAPPATGKSTLVSFLEHLAQSVIPDKRVQSVGMDGFHLRQEYLLMHTFELDGDEILAGLGQMYVADERFTKNIDKHGEGTAEYVSACIKSYCG